MRLEAKVAFVQAQTAMLNAEIAGMVAENMQRQAVGASMAFHFDDFQKVADKYAQLHYNPLLSYLQED